MKSASMQEPENLAYVVSCSRKQSDSSVSLQLHTFLGVNNRYIYIGIKFLYNTIMASQRLHIQNSM